MTRKQEDYPIEEDPRVWLAIIVIVIVLLCMMGIWAYLT